MTDEYPPVKGVWYSAKRGRRMWPLTDKNVLVDENRNELLKGVTHENRS